MLTCLYHPLDGRRIVEEDEAESMLSTGVWFDCPLKAQQYRNKVEDEIKNETKPKNKGKEK